MNLRERILATRAEAERRLALAEAARRNDNDGEWRRVGSGIDNPMGRVAAYVDGVHAAHIAANDPTTVAAEQRRIIAACDADLDLLEEARGFADRVDRHSVHAHLTARYPEVEA